MLGERASADRLRPGAERAVVEAAFDVAPGDGLRQAVDDAGLEIVDDQFVVRREIAREGRNRVWVNGSPTTVGVLSALGRRLVDIHGQHESQSLLRPAVQRDLLDVTADGAL